MHYIKSLYMHHNTHLYIFGSAQHTTTHMKSKNVQSRALGICMIFMMICVAADDDGGGDGVGGHMWTQTPRGWTVRARACRVHANSICLVLIALPPRISRGPKVRCGSGRIRQQQHVVAHLFRYDVWTVFFFWNGNPIQQFGEISIFIYTVEWVLQWICNAKAHIQSNPTKAPWFLWAEWSDGATQRVDTMFIWNWYLWSRRPMRSTRARRSIFNWNRTAKPCNQPLPSCRENPHKHLVYIVL